MTAFMTYKEECETLREQLSVAASEILALRAANKECVEYFNEMQKDLAASQAREQKLLNHIALALEFCDMPAFSIAENLANALALPQDITALEAMIQKAGEVMRARCAVEAYEWAMAYVVEDTAPVGNADAIRALPNVTLEDLKK